MPYIPAEALPVYYADDGIMIGTVGCNSNNCLLTDGTIGVDEFLLPRGHARDEHDV